MRRLSPLLIAVLVLFFAGVADAENWARFRGPDGKGISSQKGLPVTWTDKDYKWKIAVPGLGHSSPCVWDNHVFLTSALDKGAQRLVMAIAADSGKVLWTDKLASNTHEKHALNSYASGTPASDGTRVFVLFTTNDDTVVRAYNFAGKPLWQTDVGRFYNQHGHGCGTSPIVWKDTVIVASQHDGPSVIAGLDAATGKVRWRSERKVRLTAHSTPVILEREGKTPQLFTSNTGDGLASFDPRNGKLLWRANLFKSRAVLPYVPTPLAFGDHLYFWCDNGVVSCLEAKTGKAVWTERVGGKFWASPICVDGKIYNISDKGEVVVIASGTTFKVLGKSQLGEQVHSTPAVSGGRMFLRGFEHLYCLEAAK